MIIFDIKEHSLQLIESVVLILALLFIRIMLKRTVRNFAKKNRKTGAPYGLNYETRRFCGFLFNGFGPHPYLGSGF